MVVAGDDAGPPARVLAETAGWPLLAEPTSGSRTGDNVIRTYRLLLGDPDLAGRIQQVVVFGHPTLSRPVARLLARDDIELYAVRGPSGWADPGHHVHAVVDRVELEGVDPGWFASEQVAAAGPRARPVARGVARPRRRRLPAARRAARRPGHAHPAPGRRARSARRCPRAACCSSARPTRSATST